MPTATVKPPMRYRVEVEKTPSQVSRFDLGPESLRVDTTAEPTGALPGPADLLIAAFAACVLKNVDRFSKMLPFSYSVAEIDVTAERQESPPRMKRIDYVLRITTDEPWRRVDLLHRNIVAHGTVFNTLSAACEVGGEIVRIPLTHTSPGGPP